MKLYIKYMVSLRCKMMVKEELNNLGLHYMNVSLGEVEIMVHYSDEIQKTNFSDYLQDKLHYDYTYLANLFSETEGITIEHYIMNHKIERVKELIIYDELNLTEIAAKLHYSSVAHLSNQFKRITGLTPSFFKSLKDKKRNTLDDV